MNRTDARRAPRIRRSAYCDQATPARRNARNDTGTPYKVGNYEIRKEIPEQIRILFNLAIYAGLRKGEILALEFSDVDFEANTVSITKAATVVKGEQICKKPKTKMSTRTVTIPPELTFRISELRKSREQLKADLGDF